MIKLVDKMVQHVDPEFNAKQSDVKVTVLPGDDTYVSYYKKNKKAGPKSGQEVFARYYVSTKVLELNTDLFFKLDDYFGEEMTAVIDWFNQEFNQDAETVNY